MTGAVISQSPATLRAPFARPFLGISSQGELNVGEAIAEWPEDVLSLDGFTPPESDPLRPPHHLTHPHPANRRKSPVLT
jgi:hypothetical protein